MDGCRFVTNRGTKSKWFGGTGGTEKVLTVRRGDAIVSIARKPGFSTKISEAEVRYTYWGGREAGAQSEHISHLILQSLFLLDFGLERFVRHNCPYPSSDSPITRCSWSAWTSRLSKDTWIGKEVSMDRFSPNWCHELRPHLSCGGVEVCIDLIRTDHPVPGVTKQ